jgi:hypothetical protein
MLDFTEHSLNSNLNQLEYKLGLFNQNASIKANVTGATLKIK